MLDTIDTAPYLEAQGPGALRGSRQALRDFLGQIRGRFPRAPLVANGTAALVDAAPFVDGFVVEGVFATYDFGRRLYRETTDRRTRLEAGPHRRRDGGRAPAGLHHRLRRRG